MNKAALSNRGSARLWARKQYFFGHNKGYRSWQLKLVAITGRCRILGRPKHFSLEQASAYNISAPLIKIQRNFTQGKLISSPN